MTTLFVRAGALALLTAAVLQAQVPQLINYQGRVAVGAVNFEGSGQFKFSLINPDGNSTYWSNDGTSIAGSEPTAAVTLPVTKGLYSVLLGDATLAHMTIVPATVFTNPEVHLRVWFNDGPHGSQLLTPDQRIAAVGYAMMAASVPDGAITAGKIAAGAVGSSQLAPGAAVANIAPASISGDQLAPGAAATNLNAISQSGVASGGLVLSIAENTALLSAGYVRISGVVTTGDGWAQRIVNGEPPAARYLHTAVWTGSEMIVWGGSDGGYPNTGGRYTPADNNWVPISTTAAPPGRLNHRAIWTGTEMIVWGGFRGSYLNTGGRYNPALDAWAVVTTAGAPTARHSHTAIWTGTEMIVWGGFQGGIPGTYWNDGGRYQPASDSWTAVTISGAPVGRSLHTAVWTGSEMVVWGGWSGISNLNDGARFSPAENTWATMNPAAPAARRWHTAVWTGSEMIVWGGFNGGELTDGGRYSPAVDSWAAVNTAGAPAGRHFHTAVWTGSEMIVWGGYNGFFLADGGRYAPQGNSWTAMAPSGAPAARYSHTAAWTGSEMIIWGGSGSGAYLNDTFSYSPGRVLYLYQRR